MLGLAWQVALAQTGMDPGFGEHGWQTLDLAAGVEDRAYAACEQADGRLLVVGSRGNDNLSVRRLHADGSLDADFAPRDHRLDLVALGDAPALCTPDGGVLVVLRIAAAGGGEFLQVHKFDASGQRDPAFNQGAMLEVDVSAGNAALTGEQRPLGVNRADDGEYLVTGGVKLLSNGGFQPFLLRIDAAGHLRDFGTVAVAGMGSETTASAAVPAAGNTLWLVGDGYHLQQGRYRAFRLVLDAQTLAVLRTDISDDDGVQLKGARLLRPGVLVAGAVQRNGSSPGEPRLLVLRDASMTLLALPQPAPLPLGSAAGLGTGIDAHDLTVARVDADRVLFASGAEAFDAGDTFLGYKGYYLAAARIGVGVADDQVLTDFGNGGSLSLSYTRPMEPGCAGNVRDQFHAQVALSLRRPLLVGHAAHDCPAGGGSDWLLARIDHPFDRIFADGFEP